MSIRNNLFEVLISEQKVKVGKYLINYVVSKLKSSLPEKTLLLLPGSLGSAFLDYKYQLENLPKLLPNYQIVAWDPPGYGKSRPPSREFSENFIENDAECVKELMNVLNIKMFSVLGRSSGGISALCLGIKYPESIDKLILLSTHSHTLKEEIERYEAIKDADTWNKSLRAPLDDFYGADFVRETWLRQSEVLLKIYKERGGNFYKDEVESIKAETLIIHGVKDPIISYKHTSYLLEKIKNSRLITFPNGNHNLQQEYPDEFNRILVEFLTAKSKI